MTQAISRSRDHELIRELLIRYATAIDTKNWELLRSVFRADCRMTTPSGCLVGADELTAHMSRLHHSLDGSLHRLSNISISVEGDGARATSYLDALLVRDGHPAGATFRVHGVYDDVLVWSGRGWQISERTFRAVLRWGNPTILDW